MERRTAYPLAILLGLLFMLWGRLMSTNPTMGFSADTYQSMVSFVYIGWLFFYLAYELTNPPTEPVAFERSLALVLGTGIGVILILSVYGYLVVQTGRMYTPRASLMGAGKNIETWAALQGILYGGSFIVQLTLIHLKQRSYHYIYALTVPFVLVTAYELWVFVQNAW